MSEYKTCTKCKQEKPLDQFGKHGGKKSAKSGIRSTCKICNIAYQKDYAAKNKEKVAAAKKNYQRKNPDRKAAWDKSYALKNKGKIQAYQKSYRIANKQKLSEANKLWRLAHSDRKKQVDADWAKRNPDKIRQSSKRYRMNNPERVKQTVKEYRKRNPEISRILQHRRRARMKSLPLYELPSKNIRRMLDRNCAYCGAKSAHLDHIIPVAKGGYTGIGNLIQACADCNHSKNALYVMEWKLRRIKRGY